MKLNRKRGYTYYMPTHLVWLSKKDIDLLEYESSLKNLIAEIALDCDVHISSIEITNEYVHLFIDASPQNYLPDVMKKIKGITARKIGKQLWLERSYLAVAGIELPLEVIEKYMRSKSIFE